MNPFANKIWPKTRWIKIKRDHGKSVWVGGDVQAGQNQGKEEKVKDQKPVGAKRSRTKGSRSM